MSSRIASVIIALIVLAGYIGLEVNVQLTESASPPAVALISDQSQLLSLQPILDSMLISYDIYNDNWPRLYTADFSLLVKYKAVIMYKTGKFPNGQTGRVLTYPEHSALKSYLSQGGSLLVTGSGSLGNPEDELLADIVCSSLVGNVTSESSYFVRDGTHPIANGPYGTFSVGYCVSGLSRSCDRAEANTSRSAVTVAELADGNDKIIATQTPGGKVVYWNGDGPSDWTANGDCRNMLKNTLAWFVPQEHELSVSLEVRGFLEPGQSGLLNATVHNFGLNTESNVVMQIIIDGSVKVSATIPYLLCNSIHTINYLWTPEKMGNYSITAIANPVAGEVFTQNNVVDRTYEVKVYPPVALISENFELSSIGPLQDSMDIAYDQYYRNADRHYTENTDLLAAYNTVVLHKTGMEISSREYSALISHLSQGGNLLVTGIFGTDKLLAEVVGSSSVGYDWGQDALYVREGTHPVVKGPYGSFPVGFGIHGLVGYCNMAEANTTRSAVTVAELADGNDKIIATQTPGGKVVYWNGDGPSDWTTDVACGAMFKNLMVWLTGIQLEHELIVVVEAPRVIEPHETVSLTATVYNPGLNNETSLTLSLVINQATIDKKTIPFLQNGTSYSYSCSWTPAYDGDYYLRGIVSSVPGEKFTENNIHSVRLRVVTLYTPYAPSIDILIVDDNDARASAGQKSLDAFESALKAMKGKPKYFVWDETNFGRPPLSFLLRFRLVIWTCGNYWNYAVDSPDVETLRKYLEQGGNIILEGEDIGYDHPGANETIMKEVAHATYGADKVDAPGLAVTYPQSILLTKNLPQSFNWTTPPEYPDGVTPTNGGVGIISYDDSNLVAVTAYDGTPKRQGCVVYYSFPLSCLNITESNTLVSNSVEWIMLSGDVTGDGIVDIRDIAQIALRFGNRRWP